MWDGLFLLLTLSTIMAVASFFAGMLPLSLHLSQRQLRLLTAIGTGVLVGTALVVIIPEGIETLYAATITGPHTHARSLSATNAGSRGGASLADVHQPNRADEVDGIALDGRSIIEPDYSHVWQREARPDDNEAEENNNPPPSETKPPDEDEDEGDDTGKPRKPLDGHEEAPEPHAYIGLALVLGFSLMYLIDVLPHTKVSLSARSRRLSRPLYISLNNLHRGAHSAPDSSPALNPADGGNGDDPASAGAPHVSPPTTTLGLVIHAIADGIALGASSASANSTRSLGFVVFVALMLHKAPAAFGLTAVLLKQGFSPRAARAHLVVFSLAAPLGALATWISVNVLGSAHLLAGSGAKDDVGFDRAGWWTGLVLVFSGGTFLYVAMHSMQDTAAGAHAHGGQHGGRVHGRSGSEVEAGHNGSLNPYAGGNDFYARRSKTDDGQRGLADIAAVVGGMLLPLLVSANHAH